MGTPVTQVPTSHAGWLRVQDVAGLLGVSANTVRRWTDAGRIPGHRSPGGHRRYRLEDVRSLVPPPRRGAADDLVGAPNDVCSLPPWTWSTC